jgi:hypothetical protein
MLKKWVEFKDAAATAKALAKSRNHSVDIQWDDDGWVIPSYCSWVGELGETNDPDDTWRDTDTTTYGLAPLNGETLWEGYEQFSEHRD